MGGTKTARRNARAAHKRRGRPAAAPAAPDSAPLVDEARSSLFSKGIESAWKMGRNLRHEVHSLLTTDLHGLPDVQQLIRDHFHSLETTGAHLVEQVG